MSTILVGELRENPEYLALVPRPSKEEYEALKEDIKKNGVKYPLLVNKSKEIVDGYTRYQIAKELGIKDLPRQIKDYKNKLEEKRDVIVLNLKRRNLTDEQKCELGFILEPIEKELAKQRQLAQLKQFDKSKDEGLHLSVTPTLEERKEEKGEAAEKVAKMVGVSKSNFYKAKKIKKVAKKDPEIAKAWKNAKEKKKGSINSVYNKIKKKEKEEEKKKQYKESDHVKGHVVFGDTIQVLNKLEDASFDLILTDPPYSTDVENFELFLRRWIPKALQKVKETGRVYIFTGSYVDEISAYIKVFKSLKNGFTLSNLLVWHYKNNIGPTPKLFFKRGWQGIFYLYGKDAPPLYSPLTKDLFDHFEYSMPDGRHEVKYHSHQKPVDLIKKLIVLSTKEGERILDLFAGSGTIGLTASQLGRYCLSIEKERELVDTCKERGLIEYAI